MGRHYQILMPLLSLFFVRVDLTDLYPLNIPVHVNQVLDGDTVEVSKGNFRFRVRLNYIDAPEKGQKTFKFNQDAGLFAKNCLAKHLSQNETLTIFGFDQYSRVLGKFNKINLKLVQEGCVSLYPYSKFESKRERGEYIRAYFKARSERIGLWKYGGFKRPIHYRKSLKRKTYARSGSNHFIRK